MTSHDVISHWDAVLCKKHLQNEANQIISYFDARNITSLTYVDIGANVGKLHDLLSKKFTITTCIMTEPCLELYEYLKTKFNNQSNTHITNFALSDTTEASKLQSVLSNLPSVLTLDDINLGLSQLSKNGDTVTILTGFEFFNRYVLPIATTIDLIKIDTENRDYNILKSITPIVTDLQHKPLVCFEHNYHNSMLPVEAVGILNTFISTCGYLPVDFTTLQGDCFIIPK